MIKLFSVYTESDTFTPRMTLIVTQQRSGSSWLGSIFDADPDIFYLFEPLHPKVYQSSTLQLSTDETQVHVPSWGNQHDIFYKLSVSSLILLCR